MDALDIAALVGGLVVLVVGAESLVRGASRLALRFGLAPVVVGMTVVALGTSLPEATVSVLSALRGEVDLAVGNIVGSNIANIGLILGVALMVGPILVARHIRRGDLPALVLVSAAVWAVAWITGEVGWATGVVLLVALVVWLAWNVSASKRTEPFEKIELAQEVAVLAGEADPAHHKPLWVSLVYLAVGIGALVVGAAWLVSGAVALAGALGLSELVIGLTVVAVGTSLPEMATTVVAAVRGQRDIALGNAVGSNLMNLLFVLGLSAVVAPGGLSTTANTRTVDLPVMVGFALLCWLFAAGGTLRRWEGGVLLGGYGAYLVVTVVYAG